MSLSEAELTAGVSHRALETLRARDNRKTTTQIITAYDATAVIDTPMRKLEVLQSHSGQVILRNTEYVGARADVEHIFLAYAHAQSLASVLRDLEPPAEEPHVQQPTNGKVVRRA